MIFPSAEFLKIFKETSGALSVTESIAIINIASKAPKGLCIELGTYKGKSAISAALTLSKGSAFVLVDPEFENTAWQEEVYYKVLGINGGLNVKCIAGYSVDEIPKNDYYAYVFVDSGSHGDGLPMQEVKLLEDRVVKNGIIAFHDFRSQFVEVHQAYEYLLSTGKYEEMLINWQEIIAYVKENDLEANNNSWHHTEMDFPCFVGALKRK